MRRYYTVEKDGIITEYTETGKIPDGSEVKIVREHDTEHIIKGGQPFYRAERIGIKGTEDWDFWGAYDRVNA